MTGDQEVMAAFNRALRQVRDPAKDAKADMGSYKVAYATLYQVLTVVREACDPQGLAVFQQVGHDEKMVTVTTCLVHESGESVELAPAGLPMPSAAQAVGSAISYLRRYALLAAFGLTQADDDGGSAQRVAEADVQARSLGWESHAEQQAAWRLIREAATPHPAVVEFARSLGLTNLTFSADHQETLLAAIEEAEEAETADKPEPLYDPSLPAPGQAEEDTSDPTEPF